MFWPEDLLKGDIPTARILMFGYVYLYDGDVARFDPSQITQSEIHAHAESVCFHLAQVRMDSVSLYRLTGAIPRSN